MQTIFGIIASISLLLHRNVVVGFAPVVHLPSRVTSFQTSLRAIDSRQRVGSDVQSLLSNVQVMTSSPSNTKTEAMTGSYTIDEARISLERSLQASRSTKDESELITLESSEVIDDDGWSYTKFAKANPNANNLAIASIKTACADLVAQVAVAHTPLTEIDWSRTFLFFAFGFSYMGAFQYWYQVNIFKKFFDVDKFTSQSWAEKLKDKDGLTSLVAQTFVDMTVSTIVYLPTFYMFQAAVFSGSTDPSVWLAQAFDSLNNNFSKDELDLVRIWGPADLVCFSVPLYLRLPSRHAVSFLYITYFSFLRCS
jgi:hypothetical protein